LQEHLFSYDQRPCGDPPSPGSLTRSDLSPQAAGLSGEKSLIAEAQLVDGKSGLRLARIDRRRLVNFYDRTSHEQPLANPFGETQVQHFQGVQAPGEAQEQICDHRCEDLQSDGVVVFGDEFPKIEVLLDPAEQKLDLPSALIERRDLD
jgi:hypothetical protein